MLSLILSAELSGVTGLCPRDTEEEPYYYTFKVQCTSCRETHPNWVSFNRFAYEADDKRKGQKVIEIECRGLEFTEFKSDGDWEAKGTESSTPFTGIDLSEGEWYDYDEKAGEEVSIKDISWEVGRAVGTDVIIRLKWGQTEYKGRLESIDSYMNVLLRDTEEFIDGKPTGSLGLVLIRCNNILWMGSAENVEMTDLGLR
ncbi:hypothetical protein AOCH_000934 [Aspergillus ochraceoroseus]|uniref:Sm protein F n=1 Tax=Aspergillus ochraceoroseus TaxID=138278 RepID=A0A0F8WIX5_9EURO|nr:hypothetical protein AOCH_000934 [Aspergillus ochraceoroseus]